MSGFVKKTLGLALLALAPGLTPGPGLAGTIASVDKALTLAQIKTDGDLHTILVLERSGNDILGLNLSALYGSTPEDPLDLVAELGKERIRRDLAIDAPTPERFAQADLVVSPAIGTAHVAAGTNYPAHGEEVGIDQVFLFPKFSVATPHQTQVAAAPGALLDYEIELCARFNSDIASYQDFTTAMKGVFLCGDYTDRARLMREVDPDDVASGRGFTDAKSGDDRFPVGPYTVVPDDWRSFLNDVRMTLRVNGEVRQDARGAEMIKRLDEIVLDTLNQGDALRWTFGGDRVRLIEGETIRKGQVVLTGTPDGVVFRQPTTGFIFWNGTEWFFTFGFLDSGPLDYVIEEFIEDARASGTYLQPGDAVVMEATYLGEITLTVSD